MGKKLEKALQKTIQNDPGALIAIREGFPDTLSFWIEAYFKFENTTAPSSIKVKRRDLLGFRDFMLAEVKGDTRQDVVAQAFKIVPGASQSPGMGR